MTREPYNKGFLQTEVLQQGLLQPGVLTTSNQGFLQPGVLTTDKQFLQPRVYNQGFLKEN